MRARLDYYQKRSSCVDHHLLQSYARKWIRNPNKRISFGKIESPGDTLLRQRSPSVAAAIGQVVSNPNELLPPARASSSLMLHPGDNYEPPRRLSVNLGRSVISSQSNSPFGESNESCLNAGSMRLCSFQNLRFFWYKTRSRGQVSSELF